jgi:hypothetical protein
LGPETPAPKPLDVEPPPLKPVPSLDGQTTPSSAYPTENVTK